ncbi:MAG: DUF2339 domain-containing protein, partial [Bacteroidetes bacterium]|nr:DUF2339 domain-containing protein [Bacteroidota bacterium]
MEKKTNEINNLQDRLHALTIKHELLADEMSSLSQEISLLKKVSSDADKSGLETSIEKKKAIDLDTVLITDPEESTIVESEVLKGTPKRKRRSLPLLKNISHNLEDFIGRNLINKIGIVAILIGMGIGIKYTIDHDLISPQIRIVMGYLVGAILLFFSYRLRRKYTAFGAVLFSGALALLFFTSYAAHIYYELLSQGVSFAIMVALTVYGVIEALRFDQPVVAHLGLVGAYAIPFLLGDDPDKITFLFTYVAIVNLGILFIAFRRYWKSLYYAAFVFTWLIYSSWFAFDYKEALHFGPALIFLVLFFAIFYLAFLAYKLIKGEEYSISDVVILLLNSFIFYGLGYLMLEEQETGLHQLGLFTLINALVHLGISALVYSFRLADRKLFYLVSGVGLIFTIITIPVQLDGNWVSFLWAGEAALLFWIGRTRKTPIYEVIAYVLFLLTFFSLLEDWNVYKSSSEQVITPIFNIYFLTSLWVAVCFGFSILINSKAQYKHPFKEGSLIRLLLNYGFPLIFLLILYQGIQLEIAHYFDQKQVQALEGVNYQPFKDIWFVNFRS